MPVAHQRVTLRELWPLLVVHEIERSIAFYRDRLGFEVVGEARHEERVFWCRLQRGGCSLMLQQAEPEDGEADSRGQSVEFYFVCDDADALHAELTARGLTLDEPVTAYYGMRQLFVPEPDGYLVCFESPTEQWGNGL